MATIQDLGKVAYFNKGMYNSETNYEINDVVSYNGSSYVSLLNNNQGNLPTNATYWSVVALKGDKGDTGKPFVIEKTYESIEDMVADYDNMQVNDYVMIQGNIEEEENATLWTKTETEVSPYKWVYLADFSGASGITGATPNIQIGTVTEGNEPAVTRRAGSSNENPILDFVLKTGATGATGNGISSIEKTSTSGLVDTYTITYTNGNTTTFDVSNGNGIDRIEKTATVGNIDTYTIYFANGSTTTYEVSNGEVTKEELEEEVDRLSMIYNLFPTTSDEDTEMTLDGTGEVKLKKIGLKGNTSQTTYSGKNLANTKVTNWNYLGVSVSYDETTQILTINGTSTGNAGLNFQNYNFSNINASNGERINLVVEYISGSATSNDNSRVSLADTNYTTSMTIPLDGINTTKTEYRNISSNLTYNNLQIVYRTGDVYNNLKIKIMVCKGSDISYEPYVGETASPNPDYPQDIQVVTGNNSIKVEGKNLCNGITQNYYVNQAATRCGYAVGDSGLIIEVDGASDYTISSNTVQTRYRVGCLNEIPVEGASNAIVYNGSNKDGTSDSVTINTNGYKYLVVNATDLTSIQIEKESSASEFQPYQSQSYAVNLGNIELCKIGDYQDYIRKITGKNLFDKNSATYKNGYFKNDNGIEQTSSQSGYITSFTPVKPSTKYTINGTLTSGTNTTSFRLYYYDINKNWISRTEAISGDNISYTFTTPNNCYFIQFQYIEMYYDASTIMINEGETALPYEPYGKVWYIHKEIGKVVLDGNATYVKSSSYSDETWFCGYITPNVENFKNGIIAFNNRFQNGMYTVVSDKECMANNRNQLHIRILASRLNENSSSGLSEWFSTHNVEIYYVLETPTITEITDTTLIEQLDNLENAYSYDTQTNITQTNNDMPFILDVEAILSLKGVLN